MRTTMRLGAPLDASWYAENTTSFLNWADTQDAQRERMMSRFLRPAEAHIFAVAAAWDAEPAPATGGALSLLFAQEWLFKEEIGRVILSDLVFVIGSIVIVFAVLWAYTSSPLLAGLGLLQILLATLTLIPTLTLTEGVRDQLGLVFEGEELRLRFANVLVRTSVARNSPYRTKTDLKAAWLEFVESLEGRRRLSKRRR